ncbi:ABC transporter permease [Desertimonas flava]|jgi:peptide/nickel transport system permease protein|uniref:ABC transporter permease n=1 Tax=Desertimonas flava TaxID=2064846 RepID=UPI000E34D880|nr:ABC transporter permease [Desertimonas flava]
MKSAFRNPGAVTAIAAVAVLVVGGFVGLPLLWMCLVSFTLIVLGAVAVNGTQVLKRLALVIPTLLAVTFFTFFLQNSRGDTRDLAFNILGPGATDAGVDRIVKEFHLDEPMHTRFILWLSDALRGDLGNSPIRSGQPVSDAIADALPVTLQLMLYTQIVALVLAVPLGVYAAYRANRRGDKVSSMVALAALSVPNFVIAAVLVLIFALDGFTIKGVRVGWEIFPGARYQPFGEGAWEHFKYMFLPTMSLALGQAAAYMRVLRSDMIATLQENFITTAKAKGVPDRRILWGHALRPSSFTLMTVFGLNTATLIGGALIIETLFNLPGLGTTIGTAIAQKDFLVVQGVVVVIAVGFILINFLVDALYGVLDPRVRHVRA